LNKIAVNDSDANAAMGSQPGSQQLLPSARFLQQVERHDCSNDQDRDKEDDPNGPGPIFRR